MVTRSNSILRGVSPSRALSLLTVLMLSTQVFAVNQFLAPALYPTGMPNFYTRPVQTLGDFNGDGKTDILLIGPDLAHIPGQTYLSVLPGNGNGTFGTRILSKLPVNVTIDQAPLAVGDFNGDGKLDVAVSSRLTATSQKLALLLGNGDGTFTYQLTNFTLPSGGATNFISAADLNGDGKIDLILLSDSGLPQVVNIQSLLSKGDGTFQPQTPVSFTLPANAAAGITPPILADFNQDGQADFAFGDGTGHLAFLFLGNGDGTFKTATQTPIGSAGALFLVAGDFNRDGKLDLATNGKILLGNGDGTFQSAISTAATMTPAVAGDFNRDGKLDLYGSGCVSLGNGDGTFQSPACFSGDNSFPQAALVADINGDGKLDLMWLDFLNQESVVFGLGDGTFPAPHFLPGIARTAFRPIATADFNHDGNPDLAVTPCTDNSCNALTLNLSLGNADGTFQPPLPPVSGYQGGAILTGDFNGDGKPDLLEVGGLTSLQVFLGKGDGTFLPPVPTAFVSDANCLPLIADINHDGRLDLVAGSGPDLFVLLGNRDGTFGTPSLIVHGPRNFCSVAGGNFTGHGQIDLAAFDGVNSVYMFSGHGDGTFGTLPTFQSGSGITLAAADFNLDGKLDLVTSRYSALTFYLGNGDGTFVKGKSINIPGGPVSAADFNGDGRQDVVGAAGFLYVGLNQPAGLKRELFAAGDGANSFVVADFNHDGAPDVAVQNVNTSPSIVILLNTGAVAATLTSSSNPSIVGQPVAFKTTVAPTLRGVIGTPTGTVTFKDGGTILGTGKIQVGGIASFSTSTLVKGSHSITATYSGDGNFIPKSSPVLTQVVQ